MVVTLRPFTVKVKGGPFEAAKHNFGFHFWFNYILLCEQLSGFSRQVARAPVSRPVRLKPQICINTVAMLTFAVFILFGLTTPEDFWKVGKNCGFWKNTQVHGMITCLAFPLLSFVTWPFSSRKHLPQMPVEKKLYNINSLVWEWDHLKYRNVFFTVLFWACFTLDLAFRFH